MECYFLYIKNLKETHGIMKRPLGDSYLFINSVEHTGVLLGRIIHVTLQYFFFSQSESV